MCNSCASLAGLVLRFIACFICFILLVITPLHSGCRRLSGASRRCPGQIGSESGRLPCRAGGNVELEVFVSALTVSTVRSLSDAVVDCWRRKVAPCRSMAGRGTSQRPVDRMHGFRLHPTRGRRSNREMRIASESAYSVDVIDIHGNAVMTKPNSVGGARRSTRSFCLIPAVQYGRPGCRRSWRRRAEASVSRPTRYYPPADRYLLNAGGLAHINAFPFNRSNTAASLITATNHRSPHPARQSHPSSPEQ